MTIGNVIYEMQEEFKRSKEYLEPYMHIYEVRSFVERRSRDLKRFRDAVGEYSIAADILSIQQDLRQRFPNESKIFGGMCLKGAEYFKVTKKVQKIVEEEKIAG